MSDYPGRTFKTDHVSLGASFVDILSSHKKVERAVIFVLLISEWHGVIVVISNAKCKHVPLTFLWRRQRLCTTFSSLQFSFIGKLFFFSVIVWCHGSFICSGDLFITLFDCLAYIFHTTIAEFNRISVKYFMQVITFWKQTCLINGRIFLLRSWWYFFAK